MSFSFQKKKKEKLYGPFLWIRHKENGTKVLKNLYHHCSFIWRFEIANHVLCWVICGALGDLVPFVQFEKTEKHPWRSVNFSKVAVLKLTHLHGRFSRFLNCRNGTKSRNVPHLTEAYQNQVNLVLCIFGSDLKDLKLYIRVRSVSLEKGEQAFEIRSVILKTRSFRTPLQKTPAGIEYNYYPKAQHLHL